MLYSSLHRTQPAVNPQGQPQPAPRTSGKRPIFVNGRTVGHVTGDTFHKTVQGSKHMLRTPRAWASDLAALAAARQAGAAYIEIQDVESGAVYRTSIAEVLDHGFTFNRGFGLQVALPLDRWSRPDRGEQLTLFAEMEAGR